MKNTLLLLILLSPSLLFAKTDSLEVLRPDVLVGIQQEEPQPGLSWKERREPFVAGFLSYLLPGMGQVYNRQYEKAFGVVAVAASSIVMGERYLKMGDVGNALAVYGIGLGGAWLYSFIDAISTASKFNKSLLLGKNASMSLRPDLQFPRKPLSPGLSKLEPLLGLKLSVSL